MRRTYRTTRQPAQPPGTSAWISSQFLLNTGDNNANERDKQSTINESTWNRNRITLLGEHDCEEFAGLGGAGIARRGMHLPGRIERLKKHVARFDDRGGLIVDGKAVLPF